GPACRPVADRADHSGATREQIRDAVLAGDLRTFNRAGAEYGGRPPAGQQALPGAPAGVSVPRRDAARPPERPALGRQELTAMPSALLTLPYAARIGGVESWFGDLVRCLPPRGWEVNALALAPAAAAGWTAPEYWAHVRTIGKPWWAVRDYARATREAIARL